MKLVLSLVLSTICLKVAVGSSNVFERNFRILHQEPPPPLNSRSRASVKINWVDQKLDNFDPNETRTWRMRYLSNSEFFESGGPIFIFVGGEWEISSGYITGGHMYDMAKEHKGAMFYTEHRFYGKSRPTSDLATENLKYLNVKQALADLVHFITTVKAAEGMENSKIILTGGSYSATMVTWFKRLYPKMIVGAWSSSAPLLAKVDFVEYKEVTGQSIRQLGGSVCYNRIKNGIAELEHMMFNKRSAEVKAMLQICNNFDETKKLDVWALFSEISDLLAGVVQTHNTNDIQNTCKLIMQAEDDVTGIATYVLKNFGSGGCTDLSYKAMLSSISDYTYTSGMMRQWFYQTCNEYGWYQTSGSPAQPFGDNFPVDLYISLCKDGYGTQFSNETILQRVEDTNENFGGLNPGVQNVYITHGQLDPWSAMGITDSDKATVIPFYAHCKDFGSISSSDSIEMKASKQNIARLVREWLK